MRKNWRKEFDLRQAEGHNNFGNLSFADDMHAVEYLSALEEMGAKVEIDETFFYKVRLTLPIGKNKHGVRDRILRRTMTAEPLPKEAHMETRNKMILEWD
jgi:hypothetical protein